MVTGRKKGLDVSEEREIGRYGIGQRGGRIFNWRRLKYPREMGFGAKGIFFVGFSQKLFSWVLLRRVSIGQFLKWFAGTLGWIADENKFCHLSEGGV